MVVAKGVWVSGRLFGKYSYAFLDFLRFVSLKVFCFYNRRVEQVLRRSESSKRYFQGSISAYQACQERNPSKSDLN